MRSSDHQYFDNLHDAYKDVPLFVIGTGPSLRAEIGRDINLLKNKQCLTWGVNLLFHCISGKDSFMDFTPDVWSVGEIDWLANVEMGIVELPVKPIAKIFTCRWDPDYPVVGMYESWKWVWRPEFRPMMKGYFAGLGESLDWVADGGSVVFDTAVQIGAWMGCDPIYLIGCEMTTKGHSYPDIYEPPAREYERQVMVRKGAQVARREFEKAGRRLVDLSGPTGTLELEKGDFKEVARGLEPY